MVGDDDGLDVQLGADVVAGRLTLGTGDVEITDAGSTVTITGQANVTGQLDVFDDGEFRYEGPLLVEGSGEIRVGAPASDPGQVTSAPGATLDVQNGGHVNIEKGTFTAADDIMLSSTGALTINGTRTTSSCRFPFSQKPCSPRW